MRKFFSIFMIAAASSVVWADNIDEARRLVNEGDYWKARQILEKEAANAKTAASPQYNYLMGVCEFETGNYDEARRLLGGAKAKGNVFAGLYLGRLAFLDYDFEKASELYDEFSRSREKSGQAPGETFEEFERQLRSAENSLNRVEDITVIDSIAVPADGFFKNYRLPRSAGKLLSPDEMPMEGHRGGAVMAFMNESGDFMMWGEPDSVGNVRLVESIRLTDGTWNDPVATPPVLNKEGYADYPFMMPDGVTLYYASDGNDSMGGYDIFVVTRDAQTGEYLQPQNVGMPFNSPHDDFMMAIDEENGIGWWATDRNLLGDKITIYVYKVNELRKNYDPDSEDVLSRARLNDYRATQSAEDREDVENLLAVVSNINPDAVEKKADFHFPKGNGTYYTSLDDFSKAPARNAMKKYLLSEESLRKEEERLDALRRRFARNHADNVRQQIIQFEKEVEQRRAELVRLRSDVYRLERGK
ncbi:MAG: hypothetical protein K2M27_01650 [Muribaculaceae bacterium]|nr:hypothetical protein [Muribaculaceae bacterium]MDE6532222.1 hypothetical protein [Muribaculaceae bacterium]